LRTLVNFIAGEPVSFIAFGANTGVASFCILAEGVGVTLNVGCTLINVSAGEPVSFIAFGANTGVASFCILAEGVEGAVARVNVSAGEPVSFIAFAASTDVTSFGILANDVGVALVDAVSALVDIFLHDTLEVATLVKKTARRMEKMSTLGYQVPRRRQQPIELGKQWIHGT
jgi:hypothetical protein